MKHHRPFQEICLNVRDLDQIAKIPIAKNQLYQSTDWRYNAFCWSCSTLKPKLGGTYRGHRDNNGFVEGTQVRFDCSDCLPREKKEVVVKPKKEKKEKKVAEKTFTEISFEVASRMKKDLITMTTKAVADKYGVHVRTAARIRRTESYRGNYFKTL